MANTFKNGYLNITNSAQAVYTNSSGGTAIVLTLRITNVDGSSNDTITANVVDGSSGDAKIAHTMTVPADSSIELAGTSKLVLENGDKIDLTGGAASGDLEAFVSVLEIT
jgi:hypothetical protein|tara:strand:- start:38 stop:367 length:330 start_codon:yes stop_codon:yes gene_type:complete